MTSEALTQKLASVRAEAQKAEEELARLRPRVQYLEAMLLRLDGALAVLHELESAPASTNHCVVQGA